MIAVPERKRPAARVPPGCTPVAEIVRIVKENGQHRIDWRFRAEGRQYTLPQALTDEELGDVLVDLGFAGQNVEPADLAGTRARIEVATFGGHRSARVKSVEALTE